MTDVAGRARFADPATDNGLAHGAEPVRVGLGFPANVRRAMTRFSSPQGVAATVFLVYGLWIAIYFASGHDARVLIALDRQAISRGHGSSTIRYDPGFPYNGPGYAYDGGWWYLIALDPVHARYYVDFPGSRYAKILYPLVARVVALGRTQLIPYSLILVNWLALAFGTLFLARWLRRHDVSPRLALLYAFYYGLFISFQRDLTEPLSYAFVLSAIYLYDFGGRRRLYGASVCFALGIMARDKSAIFAVVYGLALLLAPANTGDWIVRLRRNVARAVLFLAIAGLPMLAYQAFLRIWLKQASAPLNDQVAPLNGILSARMPTSSLVVEVLVVFVPAIICAGLGIWALVRKNWSMEVVLLLVMIELTVGTLSPIYFVDMRGVTRVGVAIVIAALLCVPVFDRVTRHNRLWLAVCGAGWVSVTVVWATASLFIPAS